MFLNQNRSYVSIGSGEEKEAARRHWWESGCVQDGFVRDIEAYYQDRRSERFVQRDSSGVLQSGSWCWDLLHDIRDAQALLHGSFLKALGRFLCCRILRSIFGEKSKL